MSQRYNGKTMFSGENSQLYKLRRSQLVLLILTLLLLFLLLNSTYQYVDLSASNVRPLIITASVLTGILAMLSAATLSMSYRNKRQ